MLNKRKDRDHTPTSSARKSQVIGGRTLVDTLKIDSERPSSLRELIEEGS